MSQVAIVKCNNYDEEQVYAKVRYAIDLLGGLKKFIKPKSKVLLKPNLLSAFAPEKGVTTHPSLVAAMVRLLKELDAQIFIGDSPGIETLKTLATFKKVITTTKMAEIADRYGIKCLQFKESVLLPNQEKYLFKELSVAKEVLDMDAIINLPKFKTHAQMYLTLCVKNMFGCIVGAQKSQWHFHAGEDYAYFARMLTELFARLRPTLNIMDAIVGMEGDGPAAGKLRQMGLIMASADGVALDSVACELVGAKRELFFTLAVAEKLDCGETKLSQIKILGEDLDSVRIKNFRFPEFISVSDMGPKVLRKYIKRLVASRPLVVKGVCKTCGVCREVCPAKAISIKSGKVIFDYEKCIRCFCCSELCGYHAIRIHKPLIARLLKKFKI